MWELIVKKIYHVSYSHMKRIIMKCDRIRSNLQGNVIMRKDEYGFWLVTSTPGLVLM